MPGQIVDYSESAFELPVATSLFRKSLCGNPKSGFLDAVGVIRCVPRGCEAAAGRFLEGFKILTVAGEQSEDPEIASCRSSA